MRATFHSFTIMLVAALFAPTLHAGLWCYASSNQIAPDMTETGASTTIKFIGETAGAECGPIKGKFTDLSLHYKLVGQDTYSTLLAKSVPLPDNYQKSTSERMQFAAYEFVIPPYPIGTTGDIEYYIDEKFNGQSHKVDGYKRIKLVSHCASSSGTCK